MLSYLLGLLAFTTMKDCGNFLGRATNLTFDSYPLTPKAGDNVSMWIGYTLEEPPITGGIATYSYSLNGIPFSPTKEDLCTQTSCPKELGFHNETSYSIFPSGISGKIISTIQWHDQNDELVWCVETTWRV